ncbi:phosphoadenosine phosphosulfate reductase [Rhodococcus phage ReqiPine5]|uniref:PAPS reductase n=1 Tax=Rhodococcus phage ReqiPine5 TaxID=691963 RepID=D4P7X7_9CAUD|nr:phosphoadenosine phosphosulfate reductase [Rhodococcus phage ReqiPine5]ADD81107.1 PAPS reductase [Rhodococcus phage ReqiPine5]
MTTLFDLHSADPTPIDEIARMTRPEREARVRDLIIQSHAIIDDAILVHGGGRGIVGEAVLFSGGNDSTVLAHLVRERASWAIHANTTIGIEETRQFVRDTCAAWGLPLLEEKPDTSYRDLVVEQGFPGPGHHFKMYQRLKERGLRQARRKLVTDGRRQRVVFLAGRRREESARRANIVLHERIDSVIWASPLAMWTKLDMNTYRTMMGDVPVNQVSDLIHMSGECLCGAFAKPGELDMIGQFFPDTAEEIRSIERDVQAAGWTGSHCRWGHGAKGSAKRDDESDEVGMLCSSCQDPTGGETIVAR